MFVCSVCVCEGIARKDHDAPSNQDFICSHEWQMLGSAAVAGAAVASVLEIKTLQYVLDFICSHECQYIDARLRRRKSNTSAPPTPGCAVVCSVSARVSIASKRITFYFLLVACLGWSRGLSESGLRVCGCPYTDPLFGAPMDMRSFRSRAC